MRLHMRPVCNQRAANRPAVLRVTVSICFTPAGTDMRYMHAYMYMCTFRTRARRTALLSPWAGPTTQVLFSDVRTPICKRNCSGQSQATIGNKKETGILVAANSWSHWRDPARCHGSPQPRAGPLGPVRPGRMTNWRRTIQCDAEGEGEGEGSHTGTGPRAQDHGLRGGEVRCWAKIAVRR